MPNFGEFFEKNEIVYNKEDGIIICEDAKNALSKLPDNFVHLIITSPPYNVGIQYDEYNDEIAYKDYITKMENILIECYRVLVKGGRIIINLPACISQFKGSRVAYLAVDFYLLLRKIGFIGAEFITWIKAPKGEIPGKSTSWGSWCSPAQPALRDASEWIIVMSKETRRLEGDQSKIDITSAEFLRFTSNVWYMQPVSINRDLHPAQFPRELPYRAMKLYSYRENIVLDPFCGIGTTCIVAKEIERFFIGIDISKKYCEIAKSKLSQEILL